MSEPKISRVKGDESGTTAVDETTSPLRTDMKPRERRVLLMGGAELPEIRAALARRNCRAVNLSYPEAIRAIPDLPAGGVIEAAEAVDFGHPLEVVRRIRELHRIRPFDGVVPLTEYGLLPAVLAAKEFGFSPLSVRAVQNTRNKLRMRQLLEAGGLAQVRYAACSTLEQARAFFDEVSGPIFVKPVAGSASEGVSRVDDVSELEGAMASAVEASFGQRVVLCEEFLFGPEVSVEGYTFRGHFTPVAITDKLINDRFVENGQTQPSAHPEEVQEAIVELVTRALELLGVDKGLTHTELKITPRGPVIVETHTRIAGDSIHVLTERTTGVDMADLLVGLALGESPGVPSPARWKGSAIRWRVGGSGQVDRLDIPAIDPESGVESVSFRVKPGDHVTGYSSNRERLGYVIAVGSSPAEAARAAEAFLGRIRLTFK